MNLKIFLKIYSSLIGEWMKGQGAVPLTCGHPLMPLSPLLWGVMFPMMTILMIPITRNKSTLTSIVVLLSTWPALPPATCHLPPATCHGPYVVLSCLSSPVTAREISGHQRCVNCRRVGFNQLAEENFEKMGLGL